MWTGCDGDVQGTAGWRADGDGRCDEMMVRYEVRRLERAMAERWRMSDGLVDGCVRAGAGCGESGDGLTSDFI
jgi:hypothetical protein